MKRSPSRRPETADLRVYLSPRAIRAAKRLAGAGTKHAISALFARLVSAEAKRGETAALCAAAAGRAGVPAATWLRIVVAKALNWDAEDRESAPRVTRDEQRAIRRDRRQIAASLPFDAMRVNAAFDAMGIRSGKNPDFTTQRGPLELIAMGDVARIASALRREPRA